METCVCGNDKMTLFNDTEKELQLSMMLYNVLFIKENDITVSQNHNGTIVESSCFAVNAQHAIILS
jgi:hypothetical protein